jgi:S1-C subfamily serine protease
MDPRPFYRAMGLGLMALSILFPVYAWADMVRTADGAHEEVIASPLERLRDQALKPVVQLNRNCSATVIHSDRDEVSGKVRTLILTAKHCVEGETSRIQTIYVPVSDDRNRVVTEGAWKARVLGMFWKHDLALLELLDTATLFPHVAKMAAKDATFVEGEPIVAVGYAAGMMRVMTEGFFAGREFKNFPDPNVDVEYFRTTPNVIGGHSGGPMYRITPDGSYEMIAVVSWGLRGDGWVGGQVPIDAIREYADMVIRPPTTAGAAR